MTFAHPARGAVRGRRARIAGALLLLGVALAVVAVVRLLTGPPIPDGAARLRLVTSGWPFAFGCLSAALVPAQVATAGDELVLVAVGSGTTLRPAWPGGFVARRIDGRAELSDTWGNIIARRETCSTISVAALRPTVCSTSARSG
jgi:hypothetical protein